MKSKLEDYLDWIGKRVDVPLYSVHDGVVTSISFDASGCVQAYVRPKTSPAKDGKLPDGAWYDEKLLVAMKQRRLCQLPSFIEPPGAAPKSAPGAPR